MERNYITYVFYFYGHGTQRIIPTDVYSSQTPWRHVTCLQNTDLVRYYPFLTPFKTSLFSVKAFKESRNLAPVFNPVGKLLVDTKLAFCHVFRCISVTPKFTPRVWTCSGPCGVRGSNEQGSAGQAEQWVGQRAGGGLAGMTLALSHQGLHSNSTIMSLSAPCEP